MTKRETFHHGNLRAALVEAALAEIEANGLEALSLRSLADQLGVARSAPYRHFASKNALLAAVTAVIQSESFQAYENVPLNLPPLERLSGACHAYLDLALQRPNTFRLLFLDDSYWRREGLERPKPERSALTLFAAMVRAAMPGADENAIAAATAACWSALHGFAQLNGRDSFAALAQGQVSRQVARDAVVDRILRMASAP